ncbi:MAG: nuclear transport factor 2 family protein [Pseudomonadota bacterium]
MPVALCLMLMSGLLPSSGFADGVVLGNPDHAAMLQSKDPKAAANKRVVYDFWRVVVEAGHLDQMARFTTAGYIQHNPNFVSGRQNLIDMFAQSGRKPIPVEERVKTPIVAILAEGDFVSISFVRELPDPKDATRKYTTTNLALFRVENGKLAEHWDPALKTN